MPGPIHDTRLRTLWIAVLASCLALPAAGQSRRGSRTEPSRRGRPVPPAQVQPTPTEPQPEQEPPQSKAQQETAPAPRAVRFEASVFQVKVDPKRLAELDAEQLATDAPHAKKMLTVLGAFGEATILYRVDQTMAVGARRPGEITIARDTPYVSGTQTTPSGQTQTIVARSRVGGEFRLFGEPVQEEGSDRLYVELFVEIASLTGSVVEISEGVTSPVFWRIEQTHSGTVKLGKPFVLLSIDGAAITDTDAPLAFVTLVRLSESSQ